MMLSPHFSLKEMTQSQTALRAGITNDPNGSQIYYIKHLCTDILEPLRDYYEAPIKITSGYRSQALCELIKSSPQSQHCANNGAAADFEIPTYDNKEVASHIKNNFDFDQLILEYYDKSDKNSGWIHCSLKIDNNRKKSLMKDDKGYHQWK